MQTTDHQGLRVPLSSAPSPNPLLSYEQIEAEMRAFETEERARLGLESAPVQHWVDKNPQAFTQAQRAGTTILCGGLTRAHDFLISAALCAVGYNVVPLDVPDNDALRIGKEFGNRGQCNPTYFTVGNLVKHLRHLRDDLGLTTEEIIAKNVFFTAGACGPCRFGTYATEYRKALRDSGFEGFRVLLFQQQDGLKQVTGEQDGLAFNRAFFIAILKALLSGDVVNAMGYRIRPYEAEPGATQTALEQCKLVLRDALLQRRSILRALWQCRELLGRVQVNHLQPKPKVSIIGEFWAMTTEGDGNYRLKEFLESEGAEVDVQLVTAWLLYLLWQARWDTRRRMDLKTADTGRSGLDGKDPRKKLLMIWAAEKTVRGIFALFSKMIGLQNYHLPDMDEIATVSHQYYDNHLRGGEGHMEVGKLIQTVTHKKAHMVVSVKPFGCMPSSGVSDGIQSLITGKYPEAIFSAIETTGDGAANVKSRVQMDLFKARQAAKKECDDALLTAGLTSAQAEKRMRGLGALHYPAKAGLAGTAARIIAGLA